MRAGMVSGEKSKEEGTNEKKLVRNEVCLKERDGQRGETEEEMSTYTQPEIECGKQRNKRQTEHTLYWSEYFLV